MSKLKKIILIVLSLIIIITLTVLYSRYLGTKGLIIKEYKIENKIFKENFHGLKIVHISDVHYLTTVGKKELKNIVNKTNKLNPDIVVITGDLLDKDHRVNKRNMDILIENLSNINATMGKYAITGNHDILHKEWEEIINNSGFINMNENYDTIYNKNNDIIFIGGISSSINDNNTKFKDKIDIINNKLDEAINNNKDKNIYNILLIHEPDFIDKFDYSRFNLILSGHSHNGQIKLPLIRPIYLPKGSKKYYKPYYKLKDTDLYISSGIGTSNYKFRLFNKPSINFYRLTNK